MPDIDLDELADELAELAPPEKKGGRSPREERIIAGFEDIQRFVEEHGRAPQHGEDRDIFERLYAVRLDRIRALPECRALVEPLDHQGLLGGEFSEAFEAANQEFNRLEESKAKARERELKAAREKQAIIDFNKADMKAELDAVNLRRAGQTEMAKQLTKENELRKEAAELAEAVGISEKEALKTIKARNATSEESRLIAGGLALRTKERAEKREEERQTRKEDARLRNALKKTAKERQDELKPGAAGKTKDEVAAEQQAAAAKR